MTPADAELLALADSATPGDWLYHPPFAASEQSYAALGTVHQGSTMYVIADIRNWRGVPSVSDYTDPNGRFIAACSPERIKDLLRRVGEAERERDELNMRVPAIEREADAMRAMNDANARADRAEASAGEMRAALEKVRPFIAEDFGDEGPDTGNACVSIPYREAYRSMLAALSSSAGEHAAGVSDLARFGLWCLSEMRYPAPGDIEGGEAQDEAKRLGLLVEVEVAKACGEDCACSEYHGEFPVKCLRESDAVNAARMDEGR